MIAYLTTDSLPDIVDKNKQNILYLLDEFSQGGISYKDLVAKVEANAQAAAKAIADAAAAEAHAAAHDQPIRDNAAAALAAQQKADQNAADIVKAVADINANAAAIARIINDGIGGYLGTFGAVNGDDFTVLPQTANNSERAITEFPENNEIFYQEWEWTTPDGWKKLGTKTDSHIHSQSAGISLADVAAQQDPKIAKVLEPYMDQEITTTPAIYGWKTITDLWTNGEVNPFLKYTNNQIRFQTSESTIGILSVIKFPQMGSDEELVSFSSSTTPTIKGSIFTVFLNNGEQDKADIWLNGASAEKVDVTKVEIWDIITPAVKATVLVKK